MILFFLILIKDHLYNLHNKQKYYHHALSAPLVGDPAGWDGAHPERDEAGCRIWDQFGIAHTPIAR